MSGGMLRGVVCRNDRRFKGVYCLHLQGMKAVSTSGTPVNSYDTTRRNTPEDKSSSYSPPWKPQISPHEQIPEDK
jgi:hypothetical protein